LGRFRDISQVPQGILIDSDSPLWSSSLVLQLVSKPVWSLVAFNWLYDSKAIRRNVLSTLWSSMARISVIEKTELATIS
jgi:hypothetical protein